MLDFPDSPSVDDLFPDPRVVGLPQWKFDGEKWTTAPAEKPVPVPHWGNTGRLIYEDVTHVRFVPHNGNRIKINGEIYTIPDEGILNQEWGTHPPGVLYLYVYLLPGGDLALTNRSAFFHPGLFAPAMSTTPGNVGVQVLGGTNDEYTLVGMVYSIGFGGIADTPQQRHVASWFNREPKDITPPFISGMPPFYPVESFIPWSATRVSMLCWGDEALYVAGGQSTVSGFQASTLRVIICLDDNPAEIIGLGQNFQFPPENVTRHVFLPAGGVGGFKSVPEGRHTAVVAYQRTSGVGDLSISDWQTTGASWM